MPRNPTTGVFTLAPNSFSDPVDNTVIDPNDANVTFDDLASALNTSIPLAPGAILIGQTGAPPAAVVPAGDVTISEAGATAIGPTKVTSAMLNADVFSTAHSWGGVQTFTNPVVGTQAPGDNSTKAASTAFVVEAIADVAGGDLLSTNNLSDVADPEIALENLGLGIVADQAAAKLVIPAPVKTIYITHNSGLDNFTKQDWADWSALAAVDTMGAVILRSSIDDTKCFVRAGYLNGSEVRGEWWNIQGNASTVPGDMTAETAKIQAMMDFVEGRTLTAGHMAMRVGGVCRLFAGSFYVNNKLRVGNHVTLKGDRVYSSTLLFHSDYAFGNCIELGPNSSGVGPPDYVFNSRIEDLYINAFNTYRGFDSAVVYTQGAHQPSGLFNVWIWGVVSLGVHFDQGLGGPANFTLDHVEIEAGTNNPAVGDKIGFRSSGGGAMINMNTCTIQGGGSTLAIGVDMVKDHLYAVSTHFENCTVGFSCHQNEAVRLSNTIVSASGHSTVPTLIRRSLTNNNDLVVINSSNTSIATTGLKIVDDTATGFVREDGVVPFYSSAESHSEEITTPKIVLDRKNTVTIASGVITVTGSYHVVDTQAAAPTDDLDTINGGETGMRVTLRPLSLVREVVITNAGNIVTRSGASVSLATAYKAIELIYDGGLGRWLEIGDDRRRHSGG